MSTTTNSSPSHVHIQRRPPQTALRRLSASQIARSIKNFEMWSIHQCLMQVAFSDLPLDFAADVQEVLSLTEVLPSGWRDKTSTEYSWLRNAAPNAFLAFIDDAAADSPELFTRENPSDTLLKELYFEMCPVFSAWKNLKKMSQSQEKWTEQDYADNVYNVFRSHSIRSSNRRVRCSIALPHPCSNLALSREARQVLGAKSTIPDSCILLPRPSTRSLSSSKASAFKTLQSHPRVKLKGSGSKGASFRFQATPALCPASDAGFDFVSSVWEDKKDQQLVEDAYRQNRLSTAAIARHLYSLHVSAPVFGVIWANASVRIHVDWCGQEEDTNALTIFSAPYPPCYEGIQEDMVFHEWDLHQPSDIISIHFLLRQIDVWTLGRFKDRVHGGVAALKEHVVKKNGTYRPWRNLDDAKKAKENISEKSISDLPSKGRKTKKEMLN